MTTQLIKIEIKNFKSFSDIVRVNNLKSLNIVIGSNGSGKSNFMEAIAFSFGENKFRSRPMNIESFVNSASNNNNNECYVACTFTYNMEDITFKRTLRKKRNIFTVNNEIFNKEQYRQKLNEIGINSKIRYLIIYQGETIESVLENPKERAVRFEEITGSVEYKEQYEYLQKTIEQQLYEKDMLNKQKKILIKKKGYKILDKSKETFRQELQSEYENMTRKLYLLQLYIHEEKMKDYRKQHELLVKKKANRSEEKKKIQNDIEIQNVIIAENEQNIINLKNQVKAEESKHENSKKNLNDSSEKIEKIKHSIEKIKQDICKLEQFKESQAERIKQLEDEYQEIKKLYNQTEEQLQKLKEINITEMANEYNFIKETIYSTKGLYSNQLQQIHNLRNISLKNISNRKLLIISIQNEIKTISLFLDNYNKYFDQYEKLNNEFMKLKEEKTENGKSIESYREKEKEIEIELMNIEKQLRLTKSYRIDFEKNEKKITFMKSLQKFVKKGVYGYLSDLCQPIHSQYEIAVNTILRRFSSMIIVDTEQTVYLCHKVSNTLLDRKRFLTIDLLQTSYIKQSLRDINVYEGIKNVKLAIDIIKYPEKIKQAVLYAFKNTLICETPEDALHVAYNLKIGQRNNCISLNGIYFKNNGIISKSKPITQQNIPDKSNLKDTRNKLLVQLDKIKKQLITLNSNQTEKLSNNQFECIKKKMSFVKHLIYTYNEEQERKEHLESKLSSLLEDEDKDQQQLKKLDKEENKFEKEFCDNTKYKEFYKKYNITDISQFQDLMNKLTKLRSDQEKYINHIEKIKNILEHEKNVDIESNLRNYERKIDDLKKQLQEETDIYMTSEKEENKKIKSLELLQKKLKKMDDNNAKLKKDVHELEEYLQKLAQEFFDADYSYHRHCAHLYKQHYKEFCHLLYQARGENLSFINGSYDSIKTSFESVGYEDIYNEEDDTIRKFNFGPENTIQLDYSLITNEITNNNIDSLKLICEKTKSELEIIDDKISELYIDKQVSQELEEIIEKLKVLKQQVDELNKNLSNNRNNFDRIKQKRREKFMNGFDVISKWVKKIYKLLCGDEDANAFLEALNLEEPYLGEIQYICLPKKKKFNGQCNLSGGEKIIAVLSLIFAILKIDSSFLLLLDEVDAPLDKVHAKNVIEYFKTLNESHQVIYATFNRNSMLHADKLIGIQTIKYNDLKTSRIFTLDPNNY